MLCNAFAARGAAAGGANASLFARDFMFALGEVFQFEVSTTVYVPSDGRRPLVSVAAPGFVGSMVAMNDRGFAMGVDVLQAALGNTSVVGLNSLLMVRAAAHASADTAAAIEFVQAAQRGVGWIYPMSDASGAAAVLEAAPSPPAAGGGEGTDADSDSDALPDWRGVVEDATLRALLPSPAQIAALLQAPLEYSRGVFVRRVGVHQRPEAALTEAYNGALFEHAGLALPPPAAWTSPTGAVWPSFNAEEANFSAGLGQRYFSPERNEDDDLIFATNLALSPPLRIAAMAFWTSLDGMGAPQWRYDALVAEVARARAAGGGALSVASAQFALSFQSRTPGYEGATVDGILAVADLAARVLTAKGGFWVDEWTRVTLPSYLA